MEIRFGRWLVRPREGSRADTWEVCRTNPDGTFPRPRHMCGSLGPALAWCAEYDMRNGVEGEYDLRRGISEYYGIRDEILAEGDRIESQLKDNLKEIKDIAWN